MAKGIKLLTAVKEQLNSYTNPDEVIFYLGSKGYTPKEVLKHIDLMDDAGKLLLEEIIKTATDIFLRGKR